MSLRITQEDHEAAKRQALKQAADAKKEVRRKVRLAAQCGGTVPYSLDTMLSAGVGVALIRKVSRAK